MLSGWFLMVCRHPMGWRLSCNSRYAQPSAQIGVSIAKLDERHHLHGSTGLPGTATETVTLAAADSDRPVPGLLWVDVPAGRGAGPHDFLAALADHIAAWR